MLTQNWIKGYNLGHQNLSMINQDHFAQMFDDYWHV